MRQDLINFKSTLLETHGSDLETFKKSWGLTLASTDVVLSDHSTRPGFEPPDLPEVPKEPQKPLKVNESI